MTTMMFPERERSMSRGGFAKLWRAVRKFFAVMNRGYSYKNQQWTQEERRER